MSRRTQAIQDQHVFMETVGEGANESEGLTWLPRAGFPHSLGGWEILQREWEALEDFTVLSAQILSQTPPSGSTGEGLWGVRTGGEWPRR